MLTSSYVKAYIPRSDPDASVGGPWRGDRYRPRDGHLTRCGQPVAQGACMACGYRGTSHRHAATEAPTGPVSQATSGAIDPKPICQVAPLMPVYIIRAGNTGMVKIGVAEKPDQRRRELQTAHWESLRIIRVIEGQRPAERWLQQRFAAQHIRGEWYRFCDEMLTVDMRDLARSAAKFVAAARACAMARKRAETAARVAAAEVKARVAALSVTKRHVVAIPGIAELLDRIDVMWPAPKRNPRPEPSSSPTAA